jgi:hypothetical protein
MRRIGIDVGGVIIDRANDDTDTSFFSDNYLETTPVSGAFDAIRKIVQYFGPENVFIVSKCGPNTERKTRSWLAHHRVYEMTGLLQANVHFCRRREDKAPICVQVGITDFVDDRPDVLKHMKAVPRRFLFANTEWFDSEFSVVPSWADVLARTGVTYESATGWPRGWVDPPPGDGLVNELYNEVGEGHILHGKRVSALACRRASDDVLFGLEDGRIAQVHLTWTMKTEIRPIFPETMIFSSLEEWRLYEIAFCDS